MQKRLEEARANAEEERKEAQKTYDYQVNLENQAYDKFTEDIESRKVLLDTELEQILARYDAGLAHYKKPIRARLKNPKTGRRS